MQQVNTTPNNTSNLLYQPLPESVKVEKEKKGFSILDFLVILSALFVIGFLGYLVLNPDKEGADRRNVRRSADVSSVLTMLSSYVDKQGEIPEEIPISKECVTMGNEICKMGPYDCEGLVDMSFLSEVQVNTNEVLSIPSDPVNKSLNGTGYYISQDGRGNVTMCAPYAERNVEISFTKVVN